MLQVMARNWWMLALRGVLGIIFGILIFLSPPAALEALIIIFAAYALVDGVFTILTAIRGRETNERWWVLLLEGILSLAAGIGAILLPTLAVATIFVTVFAVWAIITGVLEIIAAIQLRKEIEGEFWLGLSGVVSIIFGILAFLFPGAAILASLWVIAGYAIVFGVVMILLAFRLRGLQNTSGTPTRSPA